MLMADLSLNTLIAFSVLTDVKPTDITTDSGPLGLKIYFTDEGNDDTRSTERTDSNDDQFEGNDDKLHRFLLTSTEEKQVNSRHDLYKNPKRLEIKFKTESPSSLRTVASPLLVQNSVKNKLAENAKRGVRRRRGEKEKRSAVKKAKDKTAVKNRMWQKALSVNGASWFKRYQAMYNDMLKRKASIAAYKPKPIDYNHYENQISTAAQRNILPNNEYYFNYIYPLYHLHSLDNQGRIVNQNFMWNRNNQNPQLRSRNMVPGTHPLQNALHTRKFSTPYRNAVVALASSTNQVPAANQNQKTYSRHLLQEPEKYIVPNYQKVGSNTETNSWPYAGRMAQFVKTPRAQEGHQRIPSNVMLNSVTATQEHALHSIGLKDNAAFMEASPNYDNSAFTLHAMQSLIPRAQVKSIIPKMQKTPMITATDSIRRSGKWGVLSNNGNRNFRNQIIANVNSNRQGPIKTGSDKTLSKKLFSVNNGMGLKPGKNFIQRSEVIRPKPDTTATTERNSIALSFYKEKEKPRIDFPPENDDVKRDVIYGSINPLSDIDSDDVTAENLAAIFNELEGKIDEALEDKLAKKDSIARPQKNDVSRPQDEIEMTVYDTTKNTPIQKSGVNFVRVTGDDGAGTNFEQSLDKQDEKKDSTIGSIKDTIIKPGFDLRRLHFGLRNGNTFD